MNAQTRQQLLTLADGDSFAAFKSAALACGLTQREAEQLYATRHGVEDDVEFDVRESGAELREGDAWLTSTAVARVER